MNEQGERRVLCFPPLGELSRREAPSDVPLGWSVCRGFWEVSEDVARGLMEGRLKPAERAEARRLVYRCPKLKIVFNRFGVLETRRC